MTFEIALLFALLAIAMAAFSFEWLPADGVTLLLLIALVLSGILTAEKAFSGFANEILVILASVFVLSEALARTRILDWLALTLARLSRGSEPRSLLALCSVSAALSAFLNNTNVTGLLLPATVGLAKQTDLRSSRLLIPLAYASILGGTCTLIGTSTNVAASGLMGHLGFEPFGLFEFTAVGAVVAVAGLLFLTLLGYRLLPHNSDSHLDQATEISDYLSSALIATDSPLVGRTLDDLRLTERGLAVAAIQRQERRIYPMPSTRLQADDLLILSAERSALLEAKDDPELLLEAEFGVQPSIEGGDYKLMEAIVMPRSQLVGRTLRQSRFRQRLGLSALAVYRRGPRPAADIRDLPLAVGDVLLLQGGDEAFADMRETQELWPLGELEHVPFRKRRGLWALGALAAAVLLGALGVLPLSIALLLAAAAVVGLGALPYEEVYRAIDWRLLILVGGMLSVGAAMQQTGAAELLAEGILRLALPLGIGFVLAGFALVTVVLTQPLSNAAAVLVVLPIALQAAEQLDANPRTFAVLVTLSASLSFIAPLEPASLLVYGPGRYRFADYVKTGLPLTVLTVGILLVLVPRVWPLF